MVLWRLAAIFGLTALIVAAAPSGARATEMGRLTITEENDAFASKDDRHYTQGLRLAYLSPDLSGASGWNRPFDFLSRVLPLFPGRGDDSKRKIETIIGQSIFTPTNLHLANPDPKDRPYAGWLYTGASLMQNNNAHQLENVELLLGLVGPGAMASEAQDSFHSFLQLRTPPAGWSHQLRNEPGMALSYDGKLRYEKRLISNVAVDAIPEAGLTLGNVFTYGQVGGTLRFGQNLAADFGAVHVRPSLSGSGWFDVDRMTSPLGWYLFVGAQGRAVGRNIFLDGNTWRDGPSVAKKTLVGDLAFGAALFWTDILRVDFTVTNRTREFNTQKNTDRFGMINLAVLFW